LGMRVKNPNAEVVRDRYALRWLDVPYAPGKLEAVAFRKGRIIGREVVKTAGEPAKLRVTPDRKKLDASGEDLSYLLVEAVDQDGNLCPLAMNNVKFAVEGPAKIAGVANGDHHFPAEFVADHVQLFYGKAVVVIRAEEGKGGSIAVTATSGGLREAGVSLKSVPKH
jgi:beta-galactosidase